MHSLFGLVINQQSGGHGVSPVDLSTKPGEAHRIDGECGGWSWCESCGSALGFLPAAAN
ncbi:hypothetical protein SynA1544_01182 [Synechococcus sp. A15-44]|nr:hypothetical protein SynA1544_01182 [Synechococcus sp. A15-44]